MKNWKTTVAGISLILSAIVSVVSFGHAIDMGVVTQVLSGFGLLTAKDAATIDHPAPPTQASSATAGK
jgi:hypothetical protein